MEKHCAIGRPDPAKVYPLLASLSWQLLGALPKAGSGKQKGSSCKTFSEKKKETEKISVVFPSCREGHGKDTEQTPGLGLMSALCKTGLEPNWPVPEEEGAEGAGRSIVAWAGFRREGTQEHSWADSC